MLFSIRIEDQEPVTECRNEFEYVCEEEAPEPLDTYGVPAADPGDNRLKSNKMIRFENNKMFSFLHL